MEIRFQNRTSGERIKDLMKGKGLKKAPDLARALMAQGIIADKRQDKESVRYTADIINRHLSDSQLPDRKWLDIYCRYFKCSANYLMGYIGQPTQKTTDICKETGLSQSAAELLQTWNKNNPDWISNLDTLINQPEFIKVLEYMSALRATAKFSADNYYRRKNFDKVNQALAERLTGYQPPEPDETTEKMNSTLVDLARKSDIHEIGRIMENIMDMFYVKAIDKEYSRE